MKIIFRILIAVWIFCLIVLLGFSTKKMQIYDQGRKELVSMPPLVQLGPEIIQFVTMGHKALYNDFISFWALQFLMDPKISDEDPKKVARVLMEISKHEPKMETFYGLSCFVLAVDLKHPEYCEPIISNGLRALPQSWRIPLTQGFVFGSLLKMPVKAGAYFFLAASRKDAPPMVSILGRRVLYNKTLSPEEEAEVLDVISDNPNGESLKSLFKKSLQHGHTLKEDKD